MIDYTTVRRDIESILNSDFSSCHIVFKNKSVPPDLSEYITVKDTTVDSEFLSIGDTSQLITGLATIMILTPLNSGSERSAKLASELAKLLSGEMHNSLSFAEATLHDVDINSKSVYFQQALLIPYTFAYGDLQVSTC